MVKTDLRKTLLDHELGLLVAVTARPAAPHHGVLIATAAEYGQVDWQRFLKLVERHRVAPLAFDGLKNVLEVIPAPVGEVLRALAMRDRVCSLQIAAVLITITAELTKAGIATTSIKGPTLAQQAFGDVSARQARDIDLLISPHDLVASMAALKAIGCRLIYPAGFENPALLRFWAQRMKDVSLQHVASGVVIELHWRLDTNRHLLPVDLVESRQPVRLGDASIDTFRFEDLLLYLSVHGAKHLWFRLKWLADVYALLKCSNAETITKLHARARSTGLAAPVEQMLLLLEAVYGMSVPANVRNAANRSWSTRCLTRAALCYLRMGDDPSERWLSPFLMELGRLWLRREFRYIAAEMKDLLVDWSTVVRLGGTRSAYIVAIVGRPLFWITRQMIALKAGRKK